MRFSNFVAACIFLGLGTAWSLISPACADSAIVPKLADQSARNSLEDKAFADLEQRDREKVSNAVSYFIQNMTPATRVVPRVLPHLKITTNDYNDNSILSSLSGLVGHYGLHASAAIPQLIEIASAADQIWTRERARNALVKIGPDDESLFKALQTTLQTPRHPGDIVTTTQALAQMGRISLRAVPDINNQIKAMDKIRAMQYGGISAAHRTYYALGDIALKAVAMPSPDEAMEALRDIDRIAPDKSILAFLSLQKAGRSASAATPLLLDIVSRGDEYLQGAAIDTLGFIGPGVNLRVTQTLLDTLNRGLPGLQNDDLHQTFLSRSAASALRKAIPKDAAGVPALANAVSSPKKLVRITAAQALANIGEASAPAAENLSAALRGTDVSTGDEEWKQYIRLAKAIGKDEGGLLDAILGVLDSPQTLGGEGYVHEQARANLWIAIADILAKSGEKIPIGKRRTIASRAMQALQSSRNGVPPDGLLFVGAVRVAGALGVEGRDAVPILIHTVQPGSEFGFTTAEWDGMIFHGYVPTTSTTLESIRALGRIGKPAAPALPILQTIADTKEERNVWNESYPSSSEAAQEAINRIRAAQ